LVVDFNVHIYKKHGRNVFFKQNSHYYVLGEPSALYERRVKGFRVNGIWGAICNLYRIFGGV
jgi:hypothetical protein